MISYIASLFAGIGLWTAIGVTLVAGLMRGFAGFGSAMLMAPIFAILFGSADMVVTVVAIELVVSVQLFPQVRRHADWKVLTPMSIAACAAMPLGVWLLASVDKNTIVTAVSAVIVAFVVLMWTGWKYTGRRSALAGVAVGAVSGAMMATTSVGGPPVLLYLLSGNDPPQVNRANIVTYYFLTQFLLIVIVLATGVAGVDALARAVVLFPVMAIGAWVRGPAVSWPGQREALPQRGARHPVRHRTVRIDAKLAVWVMRASLRAFGPKPNLILRSTPQACVSKDGQQRRCCPSFETPRFARLLRMRS